MTLPTQPGPRTARQQELFDELLRAFLAEGFADFTIDSAAVTLRCSKTTIYSLGRTREELIRRVIIEFFRDVAERSSAELHTENPATVRLRRYLGAMAEALRPASPQFMREVATHPLAEGIYRENIEAVSRRLQQLLAEGIASGELRQVPAQFVASVATLTMGHIQQQAGLGEVDGGEAYRQLGVLLVDGITARPDAGERFSAVDQVADGDDLVAPGTDADA